MGNDTVHTMPLDALRARAREARRLISEARVIARASFEALDAPKTAEEAADRVGSLLDAAQALLPGMAPLADERDRAPRSKPPRDSGWRRVTMRGGVDRALATIERAAILEALVEEAATLFAEIERGRSSSAFPAADTVSSDSERLPRRN
jgi:hypothetical protein